MPSKHRRLGQLGVDVLVEMDHHQRDAPFGGEMFGRSEPKPNWWRREDWTLSRLRIFAFDLRGLHCLSSRISSIRRASWSSQFGELLQ